MRKWKVLKVLSSERMEQVSSCIYGSPILCFFYDTKLHPFCDEGTLLSLILNWIFLSPFTDLLAIWWEHQIQTAPGMSNNILFISLPKAGRVDPSHKNCGRIYRREKKWLQFILSQRTGQESARNIAKPASTWGVGRRAVRSASWRRWPL